MSWTATQITDLELTSWKRGRGVVKALRNAQDGAAIVQHLNGDGLQVGHVLVDQSTVRGTLALGGWGKREEDAWELSVSASRVTCANWAI